MLVKTYSAAVIGLEATTITIEVNLTKGVMFHLSGLADTAVKESYDRICAALPNVGYKAPTASLTINLSPADMKKEGSGFDLPMAVGILGADGSIAPERLKDYMLIGELGLDGKIKPVRAVLPIAIRARKEKFKGLIVPKDNVREAAVVNNLEVYGMDNLSDVIMFLNGRTDGYEPMVVDTRKEFYERQYSYDLDFADVKGQEAVKRALEVAAAGSHNIILIGPPGSGKSMMAKRLPSILPPLSLAESLETTQIHSVAGKLAGNVSLISQRPFRSPHHTVSQVAMTGGTNKAMPGEVSLAHNGILFLDELPEFSKQTLEVLRQPLEDRKITISRASYSVEYPCSFMFVASMNPCPCGYYGDPTHRCVCTPGQIQRYMSRISGPLLDRIDLHVSVAASRLQDLQTIPAGLSSAQMREAVLRARAVQSARFAGRPGLRVNAAMTRRDLETFCRMDAECLQVMNFAIHQMRFSPRSHDRILKVARTVADLAGSERIRPSDLQEALAYRSLDRSLWT